MNCEQFQDILLQADDPARSIEQPEAAAHLRACEACLQLVARLAKLHDAAAHLPPPPSSAAAKQAFLRTLEPRRWYIGPRAIAVAASLIIGIGLGIWIAARALNPAPSGEQVVTQLVEYNMQLAQADTGERRTQIFNARHKQLQRMLERGRFTGDDAELARKLIDSGAGLASARDSFEEAERLSDLAEDLLRRTFAAANRNDMKRATQLGYAYCSISANGFEPKLNRAGPPPVINPARRAQLEKLQLRRLEMEKRMQKLIDDSPAPTKQELARAREAARKGKLKPGRTTQPI